MEFTNVRLVKEGNVYLDGKVTSRTFYTEDGLRHTLGVMLAGEYEFPTSAAELMEVVSGSMAIMQQGESEFKLYGPGESFNVPANSSFKIKVDKLVDYYCTYFD